MNKINILSGPSFSPNSNPKKLIFMLHGYGDNAENFIHVASALHNPEWQANYIALNAPSIIPNFPSGRQWFDLYPNGIYISDVGPDEIEIIRSEVLNVVNKIKNTIKSKIIFSLEIFFLIDKKKLIKPKIIRKELLR